MNSSRNVPPSTRQIERSESSGELSNWIGERIDNLALQNTDRFRLSAACLSVSLSHHVAIAALIRDGRTASAFALLRPQVDGYVRALWLHSIASDEEIEGIEEGDDAPNTRKIAVFLEKSGKFDHESLSRIANDSWPALCDFTHTGIRVIGAHLRSDEIVPAFADEEVEDILQFSDFWAMMAALHLAELAGDDDLAVEIGQYAIRMFSDWKQPKVS